jgi:hypothetical protein
MLLYHPKSCFLKQDSKLVINNTKLYIQLMLDKSNVLFCHLKHVFCGDLKKLLLKEQESIQYILYYIIRSSFIVIFIFSARNHVISYFNKLIFINIYKCIFHDFHLF